MPLSNGTRHGAYEILAPLGAGGMGEVYRARDSKLNREVALKVLPAAVAQDPERLARFRREAQVLAALNHPNIAHIHGLEESHGTLALVMELVDGATLAERIARGPIPAEEALPLARQIAEALEYAHEKGIVHRDLKPANIKLTREGAVKVLDFGLAKAFSDEATQADINASPTLSLAATRAGLILGTAGYMSPEQAKGSTVDKRADIWAFGVVLYEMLSGKRLIDEPTASEALAAVLKSDLDLGALPAATPPRVRLLIGRCLERNPKLRLRDIGEARILLDAPHEPVTSAAAPPAPQRSSRKLLGAVAGALVVILAVAAALVLPRLLPRKSERLRRMTMDLGADVPVMLASAPMVPALAISPDGTMLVFVGAKSGMERASLYLRRLDQLKATALNGTEGASVPFFSPDSQWIAFFASGKLLKISVNGGAPLALCDSSEGLGGSWSEDGTIYFAPNRTSPLMRVSSAGGTPQPFSAIAPGENAHRWPQALPGGKAVLFNAGTAINFDQANIVVRVVATGETKIVQRGGYHGRYLSSGHLVFLHEGTLFAAPFNLDRLETTAQPVPILEGMTSQPSSGTAQYSVAQDGTLVYLPGGANASGTFSTLSWLDRTGKTTTLRKEPDRYVGVRLSPDGRSVAMAILGAKGPDLWIYESERGATLPLTHDGEMMPGSAPVPVWTPDGRRIGYLARQGGVYWRPADGAGDAQPLTDAAVRQFPSSWHPSGKYLALGGTLQQGSGILILSTEGERAGSKPGQTTPFVTGQFLQGAARFSPDGRWLAYQSNESGRAEIYVRPFPGPGSKWPISTNGGTYPAWSAKGKELYYLGPDQKIMVVSYTTSGDVFQAGKPEVWSDTKVTRFEPHPDGRRMAVLQAPQQDEAKPDKVVVVTNFFADLLRSDPHMTPP